MKYPSKGDIFGIAPDMPMDKLQARQALLQNKDVGECVYCKRHCKKKVLFFKENLEAVLIVPKSEGGLEVYSNYQLVCSAHAREV